MSHFACRFSLSFLAAQNKKHNKSVMFSLTCFDLIFLLDMNLQSSLLRLYILLASIAWYSTHPTTIIDWFLTLNVNLPGWFTWETVFSGRESCCWALPGWEPPSSSVRPPGQTFDLLIKYFPARPPPGGARPRWARGWKGWRGKICWQCCSWCSPRGWCWPAAPAAGGLQ